MASSIYSYVRSYEGEVPCLPNTWIVVRVDGQTFHKFADKHAFNKPNDERALRLANVAARHVMCQLNDIILAYGQSDEYSFVFRRTTDTFNRRPRLVDIFLPTLLITEFSMWVPAQSRFYLSSYSESESKISKTVVTLANFLKR